MHLVAKRIPKIREPVNKEDWLTVPEGDVVDFDIGVVDEVVIDTIPDVLGVGSESEASAAEGKQEYGSKTGGC